jgi:HSP20 family protein
MTMTDNKTEPTTSAKGDASVEVKPETTTTPAPNGEQSKRRWNPFERRDELHNDMLGLWGHAMALAHHPVTLPRHRFVLAPTTWAPSTDVYEQDGSMVVKAELPGLKKEDIEVSLDRGDLVIRGERSGEREVQDERYFRMERTYGSFYRRIPLPAEVREDQITARYTNGVLEVRVPLPAQAQTGGQKISVTG